MVSESERIDHFEGIFEEAARRRIAEISHADAGRLARLQHEMTDAVGHFRDSAERLKAVMQDCDIPPSWTELPDLYQSSVAQAVEAARAHFELAAKALNELVQASRADASPRAPGSEVTAATFQTTASGGRV